MTQTITYGGVDVAGHIKLPEGITGLTSHADGGTGAGEALIDDGAGIFNLVSLQEFIHEEDACSQPRTFTGFLVRRTLSRGSQVPGAGRDHALDIVDLNYLLTLQPLRGATAKRPVESGDDRMAWLMASVAMDGIVFDNGLIGSNPNMFDEADYTLQYANDVLQDLSVSSSAEVGRIFFVYRDSTSGEPSLFMDRPTATSYTSTLSISNDLSDLSDTCFAPYMDAELESSGEDIYCSVFFKYKTGTVYRHNATTHATYFASKGYHRQGVFETSRIGSEATAIRHADAWLANHSGDLDQITCQIQLPADKVNLIEAGMRVNCKFTHFPGYDSFGYLRVSSRTVGLEPVNDLYLVRLVLSNRTLSPVEGGDTGDFPYTPPPCSTPALVQSASGTGDPPTLDSAPTEGNTIILTIAGDGVLIDGFADALGHFVESSKEGSTIGFRLYTHQVQAGDDATYGETITGPYPWHIEEWSGLGELTGTAYLDEQGNHHDFPGAESHAHVPISPTGSGATLIHGTFFHENTLSTNFAPDSGYTSIETTQLVANTKVFGSVYKIASTNAGSYDPGVSTLPFVGGWCGAALAFVCTSGPSDNPPASGQPFGPVIPVETPDGVTTTFTLPAGYEFADGSLRVYVDRLDQTAAVTSYDGAARTFTLAFVPAAGELVEAYGMGR